MFDETTMSFEEKSTYALRSLYAAYGYLPYKMSKFEEYELYIRNKEFLVSDRVITFNDTNGKLMALKPDVTLSIIKNGEDVKGTKQKVFYNENVYRVSESTHRFKEIMQTGLECIGDVDLYDIYEVITLAAKSLATVSDSFCIEISNLDLVRAVLSDVCNDENFIADVICCIAEKNCHDLKLVCERYGVEKESYDKIASFITVYGDRGRVIKALSALFDNEELHRTAMLSQMLDKSSLSDKIRFDFSVMNDMNYYNGFVFKGFVDGVCDGVLTGGQYDGMMKKMNRTSGAIGFAVYLDRIEDLHRERDGKDVDVLLVYDETTSPAEVAARVDELTGQGMSVSAQKCVPEKLRYGKITDLRGKNRVC